MMDSRDSLFTDIVCLVSALLAPILRRISKQTPFSRHRPPGSAPLDWMRPKDMDFVFCFFTRAVESNQIV